MSHDPVPSPVDKFTFVGKINGTVDSVRIEAVLKGRGRTRGTSMSSRPACRPASGEAWARDTIFLSSRVSSTSWRTPLVKIQPPSGERISRRTRGLSSASILRRKRRVGEALFLHELDAG